MKAITITDNTLTLSERPTPTPQPHEVLIQTAYAGLNRADIFQRQGHYAPPQGVTDILGLEASGTIVAVGSAVSQWEVGDEVCALLPGGGYAQYATAHANHCLPIPSGCTLAQAAALPECVTTVWMALFDEAKLQSGERVLIHGGASGIGTTAIQMLRAHGCDVWITAGSDEKCRFCETLGANSINYHTQDFVAETKEAGGVDVILDMVGGDYIARNFKCLKPNGRLVSIALLGGATAPVQMGGLLLKNLRWSGVTLRAKPDDTKAQWITAIRQTVWPLIESGAIRPVIDQTFPLADAMKAQDRMQKSLHCGKILLQIGD